MEYLFENLGDDRFQEFCSSLISKKFPHMQAFPIAQPDGGRDSIVYFLDSPLKEFIVFQVKYVRNPKSIPDVHKWFTKIIKEEAPKIDKLIPKGAKEFYLITNVQGTAHLDTGSKDIVNKTLEDFIKIPSICWWSDDISRFIDADPIFKWAFPEILNGQDMLNSILFQNINENRERRENVIRAYLADQYEMDNDVKFRQIELQNKLFSLYTDVGIKVKKINQKNKDLLRTLNHIEGLNRNLSYYNSLSESYILDEAEDMGAAEFLLHTKTQNEISRILLEGGPGQGKSTISQYICQVHRAILLEKVEDIKLLPEKILNNPVRLPFKIDLRHIASWVEKRNPYQSRLTDENFNEIYRNSLESFLIGHISYHSQLENFDTNDFIAIAKNSSILFVFDGFDEIANIKIREEVIDFINKGITRISENARSIQIVVTSRPAAFSDSIGFSIDLYPHFELKDVSQKITKEYVDKWIKASRLDGREASEIKRLVAEKLEMPHLKDLAKSPMQLAIFISLLRTRGDSLPNKRTALYDSYIELFFNRESEKSTLIRDHRDLIIDIHQYLAWILHSEAELLQNTGSIALEDLKLRLKLYLQKEGHATNIADQLFDVVKERVCALVSRVQGTFEFEVQPLREYFCAKYLYNTSPYSPAGNEKSGTKPERFDAISRNFYWHNVVRFFAGCFDKGELPMLIQKLKELQDDEDLKYTSFPRLITSQILSDWVFTQYPFLMKDVVKIIVDGINIGTILNYQGKNSHNEPIRLPAQCGSIEVVEECFLQLQKFPHSDYASELIGIINNNPFSRLTMWENHVSKLKGEELLQWLSYGLRLQLIHTVSDNVLLDIINADNDNVSIIKRLQIIISGGKMDIIDKDLILKELVLEGILSNSSSFPFRKFKSHSLRPIAELLDVYHLVNYLLHSTPATPLYSFINRGSRYYLDESEKNENMLEFTVIDEIDTKLENFIKSNKTLITSENEKWNSSIEPWDKLVESLITIFSNNWKAKLISIIASSIKSKDEKFEDYFDLEDSRISLCKRVRCARMKSGNVKYWDNFIRNTNDLVFVLTIYFTWVTPKTLIELESLVSTIIDKMPEADYLQLISSLELTTTLNKFSNQQQKMIELNVVKGNYSDEYILVISQRFQEHRKREFIYQKIKSINKKLINTANIRLNFLIERFFRNSSNEDILTEIKQLYSQTKFNFSDRYYSFREYDSKKIPLSISKLIMADSKSYPRVIASVAEKVCRFQANSKSKPVGQIAKNDNWFQY